MSLSFLKKNFLMLEDNPSTARLRWRAAGSALVADALCGRGSLRLRVHGESMLPTLWPGEVVEIEGCPPEEVRPGEIVLARRDGRLFLHRLVAPCAPNGFRLRGDSVPGADPPYPPEALLGKLVRRVQCPAPKGASDLEEVAVSLKRYPDTNRNTNRSFFAALVAALGLECGAQWFGVKWSRAVGMLLCHCGLARRLALKLHGRQETSVREFRNPEPAADSGSAEPGVL
jgi:hypothetical protein